MCSINKRFLKILLYSNKKPVLESLFNKFAGLQVFPVNITKSLETLEEHLPTAASISLMKYFVRDLLILATKMLYFAY